MSKRWMAQVTQKSQHQSLLFSSTLDASCFKASVPCILYFLSSTPATVRIECHWVRATRVLRAPAPTGVWGPELEFSACRAELESRFVLLEFCAPQAELGFGTRFLKFCTRLAELEGWSSARLKFSLPQANLSSHGDSSLYLANLRSMVT
ncbi:hypothetical protein K438DRAFT_1770041 [Mycena galopus ATCC 62051]|nr:hypothetical protein K438DRAFT_1770041 [Mycena galopus ATCC 62051]